MLCFQCEQTSAGKGCTTEGICGKHPPLAGLQDLQVAYTKRLCQLAVSLEPSNPLFQECGDLVLEATFATLTNVNFDDDRFGEYLRRSAALAERMEAAAAAVGANVPPPQKELPQSLPTDRKELLLASGPAGLLARSQQIDNDDLFGVVEMGTYGFKGTAAYLYHAEHLGKGTAAYSAADRDAAFAELFRLGAYLADAGSVQPEDAGAALNTALGECLSIGALNLKVMGMLDAAHCHVLGTPSPSEVSTVPAANGRPCVLISGHDLNVLRRLLEQTDGQGVDVYTHGEMLPAFGYPGLRKFEHLRGHFGTHWGNQLSEFRQFPGAILMTSNCLRPPTRKYKDRLFTCGPVGFGAVPNVSESDFSPVIDRAKQLPGFSEALSASAPRSPHVSTLTTGFGHGAVLSVADKVIEAVKSGALKHIFVIGGCDGTEGTRNYFTDLGQDTPKDSIMLTLGCGKFRLNGHDHGTLGGLPRLLDMGQCNDAYGAIIVATKLAEALGCGVHELPLHFAVSWFEQKAVAVLLTLLHLELKNIRIGPAVPAFLTPNVQAVLNEKFGLMATDLNHEDEDLEKMLQGA